MQLFAQLPGMNVMYYQSRLECFSWTNLDGQPAQVVHSQGTEESDFM